MIALVTDSASMLPPVLREGEGVLVAAVTVVVDGKPFREGVEIDSADFYRRLAAGAEVSTSAPSPGEILACYESAARAGASAVVSIHTGGAYSAVIDAARVAARSIDLAVEHVDTGTVSFPVALCVAAAADVRRSDPDATSATIASAARAAAREVDSIFIVGAPELAQRGGRFVDASDTLAETTILTLGSDGLGEHGTAADVDDAIDRMASHVRRAAHGTTLRVGVGDADRPELGARLAATLGRVDGIVELIRYDVGPSVGAHSGPGTVGAVWAPIVAAGAQ